MNGSLHACFTLNNYTEESERTIQEYARRGKCSYLIYGREVAPTTLTPHLQGYIQWASKTRWAALSKQWKACFTTSRGSSEDNVKYCSKEDASPWSYGQLRDISRASGGLKEKERWRDIKCRFADLSRSVESIMLEVVEEYPDLLIRIPELTRSAVAYRRLLVVPNPTCTELIPNTWGIRMPLIEGKCKHYWIWSRVPNTGKTTFMEALRAQFRCSDYIKDSVFQDVDPSSQFVLIDEYNRGCIQIDTLNAMCDGTHPYQVKFCSPTRAKAIIIICSNALPSKFYSEFELLLLKARFNVIQVGPIEGDKKSEGETVEFSWDLEKKRLFRSRSPRSEGPPI